MFEKLTMAAVGLLVVVGAADAVDYTWTKTSSGAVGYWVNSANWNPATAYPANGDGAHMTNTIASGAYTNILDATPGGTLTTLMISSSSAGQAWLVVTNAALNVTTMNLGNGGVLLIDNGGKVTNNTASSVNYWFGTNGTVYLNSGGTLRGGTTIGYGQSNTKATISSTDASGGSFAGGGLSVGRGADGIPASRNNHWTIGGGVVATVSSVTVGQATRHGTAANNQLTLDGGASVTSSGALIVGKKDAGSRTGNGDVSRNKVSIQDGARLSTSGASVIGYDTRSTQPSYSNSVTVAGADSLWDLGGGALTVGRSANSSYGNALTVTAGGVVTNAGAISLGYDSRSITNYLSVSTGTVHAASLTTAGTAPTVTLGLNGKIIAGAVTITNAGVLNVHCERFVSSSCGRMDVSGALDISGATLNIVTPDKPTASPYVIATYNTLTGTFGATNGVPSYAQIEYNYHDAKQIVLLGQPVGTVIMVR